MLEHYFICLCGLRFEFKFIWIYLDLVWIEKEKGIEKRKKKKMGNRSSTAAQPSLPRPSFPFLFPRSPAQSLAPAQFSSQRPSLSPRDWQAGPTCRGHPLPRAGREPSPSSSPPRAAVASWARTPRPKPHPYPRAAYALILIQAIATTLALKP